MCSLWLFSARISRQHGDATAGNPRPYAIGATCKYDWDSCPQHQPGTIRIGQETELLGENVPRFKVGRQKDVRVTCDKRADPFGLCRLLADCVVERKRTI